MSEQLGDDFGFQVVHADAPTGVFVDDGDGAGGFYEFGDDDGTITVTKTDGTIAVSTDGDVNEQSFDLDADNARWEAADQACAEHLPDVIGSVFHNGPFEAPND